MSRASAWARGRPQPCITVHGLDQVTLAQVSEDGAAIVGGLTREGLPMNIYLSPFDALRLAKWVLTTFGESDAG